MAYDVLRVDTALLCKNSMLREGLKHTLLDTHFRVCSHDFVNERASAGINAEASSALFILDANLHQGGTADFVRDLKKQHPEARVVVIADEFSLDCMMAVLQSGADGYCLSTVDCEVLVKYLDLVMLGETVFPAAMFLGSLAANEKLPRIEAATAERAENLERLTVNSPIRTLSSREAEILHCLMQGAPNKIIARKLEVAEATVKVHIKAILRKIRVTNRTQAAMWAVAHLPAATVEEMRPGPR
jgi:two-component system, NarL family, nitrate/nitrite response regulator NarL